jgi:stage II sporulation protein D
LRRFAALLLLLLAPAAPARERSLRVGIFVDVSAVSVGPGAYRLSDGEGASLGVRTWTAQAPVRAAGKGLKVGGEALPRKLRLEPLKEGGAVVVNGRSFRGTLEIFARGGRLTAVNELEVEDYLRGVVGSEMPPSWPLEALKAQTVVARSYAEANRGRFAKDGYDICATAACQVYDGVRGEKASTDKAVAETRGRVLLYKGKPVSAVFHSCCGGRTDDARDVWRSAGVPYLRGVKGRWCGGESPHSRWEAVLSADKMSARLAAAGQGVGRLRHVRIASRTGAGRAYEVRVQGDAGARTLRANDFRLIVGARELRSTLWTGLSRRGGSWRFNGRGWGHGVGLCQWCAKVTAAQGHRHKEILAYFYRNVKVKEL